MRLTAEQKEAFTLADRVCAVISRGRGQYGVRSAWRELTAQTETPGSYTYIAARQVRARFCAWDALRHLGYDAESIDWALPPYYAPQGRALDIYRSALAKLCPVECGEPSE